MPKKYRKFIAKGSQNEAKMDIKINENSYFSEKAEMFETICFTIENVVRGT